MVHLSYILFVTQSTGWEVGGWTVPAWPCSPVCRLSFLSSLYLLASRCSLCFVTHIQTINICRQCRAVCPLLLLPTTGDLLWKQHHHHFPSRPPLITLHRSPFLERDSVCRLCMGATACGANDRRASVNASRAHYEPPCSHFSVCQRVCQAKTHSLTICRHVSPPHLHPQGSISARRFGSQSSCSFLVDSSLAASKEHVLVDFHRFEAETKLLVWFLFFILSYRRITRLPTLLWRSL